MSINFNISKIDSRRPHPYSITLGEDGGCPSPGATGTMSTKLIATQFVSRVFS